MIIHTDIKQIIRLITRQHIHIIIAPRKTVTVDRPLTVIVITGEEGVSRRLHKVILGGIAQIDHTQIGIITRIFINAVGIVWRGAVAVVVLRLTILGPAALSCLKLAFVQIELGQFVRPDKGFALSEIVV